MSSIAVALDREGLIERVAELEQLAEALHVDVGPDGDTTVCGVGALQDKLNEFALDVRTLDIEASS